MVINFMQLGLIDQALRCLQLFIQQAVLHEIQNIWAYVMAVWKVHVYNQ